MNNPFYINPMADRSQALQGLSGAIADYGKHRDEQALKEKSEARFNEVQGAMKEAWASQDPDKMAEVSIMYPEARESMELMFGFYEDKQGRQPTKEIVSNAYRAAMVNPEMADEILGEAAGRVFEITGKMPENMIQDIGMARSGIDPNQLRTSLSMGYASIDPEGYKAYKEMTGIGGATKGSAKIAQTPTGYDVLDAQGNLVRSVRSQEDAMRTKLELDKRAAELERTKLKAQEETKQAEAAKETLSAEADDAISNIDALLEGDVYQQIYGSLQGVIPSTRQSSVDAEARRDKISGLLSLENRQKLKGQGTITDSEQKILEKAASVLSNPRISDDLAKEELERVKGVFERAKKRSGGSKKQTDSPAMKWAKENPDDPRAQRIMKTLGM